MTPLTIFFPIITIAAFVFEACAFVDAIRARRPRSRPWANRPSQSG